MPIPARRLLLWHFTISISSSRTLRHPFMAQAQVSNGLAFIARMLLGYCLRFTAAANNRLPDVPVLLGAQHHGLLPLHW
jgi:hypothetical protein